MWWAFVLTGVATVFFYARLWRRSGVMTDLEFYEIRYSGKAARVVRGFRAVYLGLLFNCMIMATVNLAACKIAGVLFGFERWQTLAFVGALNVVFATHSGLWGVLVIDMIQFFIKMTAVIAAAYFALHAPGVGGLDGLVTQLSATRGRRSSEAARGRTRLPPAARPASAGQQRSSAAARCTRPAARCRSTAARGFSVRFS